jgi:hypothetical protein
MTQPKSFSSMSLAIAFVATLSVVVTTGLLMASLTSILVLNPISDIAFNTFCVARFGAQVNNKKRGI